MWMTLFGLMNTASRRSVPRANFYLGWAYILIGIIFLYLGLPFSDPRPMGMSFGFGEIAGGWIFIRGRESFYEKR
jgi:hypothetical protein